MPTPPLTQVITINAVGGRYRLERTDTHSFVELAFDATADQVAAALRALFDMADLKVTMDRIDGSVTYTVTFIREAAARDFAALCVPADLATGGRRRSQRVRQRRAGAARGPARDRADADAGRDRRHLPAALRPARPAHGHPARLHHRADRLQRERGRRRWPPSRRSWTRTTATRCCRTPATSPSAATAASTGSCSAARTRRRRSAGSTRARSPARSRSPRAWTASTTTASRRWTSTSARATTCSTSRARRRRPTSRWPPATSASTCPRARTTASRTTPTTSTATSTRSSAR